MKSIMSQKLSDRDSTDYQQSLYHHYPMSPDLLDWFQKTIEEEIEDILAYGPDCVHISKETLIESYEQYKEPFIEMIFNEANKNNLAFGQVLAILIVRFCISEIAFYVNEKKN